MPLSSLNEPRPGKRKAAFERGGREAEDIRCFLDAEADEESKLDDFRLFGIEALRAASALRRARAASLLRWRRQRSDSVSDTRAMPAHRFSAPLALARSTRIWRMDRAAIPTKCFSSTQGLPASASRRYASVNQCRGLERLAGTLAAHERSRETFQLVVDLDGGVVRIRPVVGGGAPQQASL